MVGIELAVGVVVASYLILLTVSLSYLGFAALGADERERSLAQHPEEGPS
jgi:hypothetical protein